MIRPKSVLNPSRRKRKIYYRAARCVTPIEVSVEKVMNNGQLLTSPIVTSPSEIESPSTESAYSYTDIANHEYKNNFYNIVRKSAI